jgi:hypothetical protein
MEASRQLTPTQVGEYLGLRGGMVRRYLMAWESITGEPLPRDPKTNARLASDEALRALEQARAVVKENPAVSVEDALRACLGLHTAPTAPAIPNAVVTEDMLRLLQDLTETVREQTRVIQGLESKVEGLERQLQALPAPQETPKRRGLLGWFRRN